MRAITIVEKLSKYMLPGGSLLANSEVTTTGSVLIAATTVSVCVLFRKPLTATRARILGAGVTYALTALGAWTSIRVLSNGFHWSSVEDVSGLAVLLIFIAIAFAALTLQLSIPLWFLGQGTSVGPLSGLFLGTVLLFVFVLNISHESGNLIVYLVGIYPLAMGGVIILGTVERSVRRNFGATIES